MKKYLFAFICLTTSVFGYEFNPVLDGCQSTSASEPCYPPVNTFGIGPTFTIARQSMSPRSYTSCGVGILAYYQYFPHTGPYVKISFEDTLDQIHLSSHNKQLKALDARGVLGTTFYFRCREITPWVGLGYARVQHILDKHDREFSSSKLNFNTFYVPVWVKNTYVWDACRQLTGQVYALFDVHSYVKVKHIHGIEWTLHNRYGFGTDLSFQYLLDCNLVLELLSSWKYFRFGPSNDRNVDISSFGINLFSIQCFLIKKF